MVWYDVIMPAGTTSTADAVELFDIIRHVAKYDEAKRAETWARQAEEKARSGSFKEGSEDDYMVVLGNDGKAIEIIALP